MPQLGSHPPYYSCCMLYEVSRRPFMSLYAPMAVDYPLCLLVPLIFMAISEKGIATSVYCHARITVDTQIERDIAAKIRKSVLRKKNIPILVCCYVKISKMYPSITLNCFLSCHLSFKCTYNGDYDNISKWCLPIKIAVHGQPSKA